jgi:hypothetical protein
MKFLFSLVILLAIVVGVRYFAKPQPVDQALVAQIQDKIDQMEGTGATTTSGSTTSDITTTSGSATTGSISGDVYTVVSPSVLGWIGRKVGGEHTGSIVVKSGQAIVANNALVGGAIVIDMNSITVSDLPAGDMNDKLVWHLKDGFFAVATNPEAKFVITAVSPSASGVDITGDLTLKGVTKSINFPATVTIDPNTVKIQATTYIDKDQFGITEWAGVVDKLFGLVFDLTFNK